MVVYIHIPFCKQKCGYCDFNSYAGFENLYSIYVGALISEIEMKAPSLEKKPVRSIYFGGGTPTLIKALGVNEVLEAITRKFDVASDAEITIEANPETIARQDLCLLRTAGVNRVSIGFQSLDDKYLDILGRKHSSRQAITSFLLAREAGFDNINVDLIYGTPGQSLANWFFSLEQSVALNPDHISCYSLTIEEGTPLALKVANGELSEPDEDVQADMMMYTVESLTDSGYEHYEISNFAKPGKSCGHNLAYWNNEDYIGFGAGAHSKLADVRYSNVCKPEDYIKASRIGSPGAFLQEEINLSLSDQLSETIFLGLRKTKGVSIGDINAKYGCNVLDIYSKEIERLVDDGLIVIAGGVMRLTSKGIMLGNEVFAQFV